MALEIRPKIDVESAVFIRLMAFRVLCDLAQVQDSGIFIRVTSQIRSVLEFLQNTYLDIAKRGLVRAISNSLHLLNSSSVTELCQLVTSANGVKELSQDVVVVVVKKVKLSRYRPGQALGVPSRLRLQNF